MKAIKCSSTFPLSVDAAFHTNIFDYKNVDVTCTRHEQYLIEKCEYSCLLSVLTTFESNFDQEFILLDRRHVMRVEAVDPLLIVGTMSFGCKSVLSTQKITR